MQELYWDLGMTMAIATYLVWGFAFSLHALLVLNGNDQAVRWARKWYSRQMFLWEARVFYPLLVLNYLLFEVLPAYVGLTKEYNRFSVDQMITIAFGDSSER